MQSFQASGVAAQGPKNYVFVDEHNRHKRLKVMRACEGCRRRKIKCDAATTNTWPCAACKRLKLTCIPPVGGIDGDLNSIDTSVEQYASQPASAPVHQYSQEQYQYLHNYGSQPDLNSEYQVYDGSENMYSQQEYQYRETQHEVPGQGIPPPNISQEERLGSFDSANGFQSVSSPQSAESVTAEELVENFGELNVADTGIAPYIRQQNGTNKDGPAPIIEDDEDLPAFSTAAGSQIRIPPALLPTDEEASNFFQDFFTHVHPYVPVLCRSQFLRQWQYSREAISPLLLEAVLACAGQVSDNPAGGLQWLALANRHEESFADMPRLSTIQALLLILKAREKNPKKGYFYRSWILVKKIVGMAKDLDLHEHLDIHRSGGDCGSTPADCLSKTRIWQLAMMVETMVGGPQGRSDYGVDIDTIELDPSYPNADIDEYEKAISRQFSYWVQNVRNIKGITETYHKLKRRNKEWATDPTFVAYNEDFRKWPAVVPQDLVIPLSPDGTISNIPSHYLANMHSHHQLGVVLLYKPQLTASKDFANDEKWNYIMTTCYNSAKQVCAYQESILKHYDILGLACMQRGLSYPIYAILSCVMIHLIAICSPEPKYNKDAKSYFIRHMRVLERCISEWPMPEVEAQINGLRAAFSVDLRRPFDLKPTFPYGTPSERSRSPEERRASEPARNMQMHQNQQSYSGQGQNAIHYTQSIPPNTSTQQHSQHLYHGYANTPQHFHQVPPTSHPNSAVMTTPTEPWNPTPIIDQFNTAFAIPPSALAPPPPSSYSSSPPVTIPPQSFHPQMQNQQFVPSPTSAGGYTSQSYASPQTHQTMSHAQAFIPSHSQTTPQPQLTPSHYPQQGVTSYFDPNINQQQSHRQHQPMQPVSQNFAGNTEPAGLHAPVYVTPKEWQQSVASVFDPNGLKRKWGYEQELAMQQHSHNVNRYGSIG